MEKDKKITIKDIAKEAGVSLAAVSMVINDRYGVSEKTRKTVKHVIKQLNYIPCEKRLNKKPGSTGPRREQTIALIAIKTGFYGVYSTFMHQIERELTLVNMPLQIICVDTLDSTPAQEAIAKADAVIVMGLESPEIAEKFLGKTPCVWAMGEAINQNFCDRIMPDNARIGRMAADFLLAKGHSSIVYPVHYHSFHIDRSNAFLSSSQGAHIIKVDDVLIAEADKRKMDAFELMLERFKQIEETPTAIFCPSNYVHFLSYLKKYNLDILFCDVDMKYYQPATVMDINSDLIGKQAVRQLLWRIKNPNEPYITQLVNPTLIELSSSVSGIKKNVLD